MISGTAIFDDFLGTDAAKALLDFALEREEEFSPSSVVHNAENTVYLAARQSSTFTGDWTQHKRRFHDAVIAKAPEILAATGISDWSPKPMQIDLAAHRDGDYFRTHADTQRGANERGEVRVVSAVYYLHRSPKAFSGGELLMRDIRSTREFAVEPRHDRLVVFPSFLPHEVAPISVPGNAFADARFSVNCWLNRLTG